MALSAVERSELQRISQMESNGYFDGASKQLERQRVERFEAQKPGVLGFDTVADQETIAEKSFAGRAVSDFGNVSFGLLVLASGAVALPFKTAYGLATSPKETVSGLAEGTKILGGAVIKGFKDPFAAFGVFGEKEKRAARTYYAAHPGFAALDALGIATFGAGTVMKTLLTSSAKAATILVAKEASKAGIKGSAVDIAMMSTRSVFNPSRWVRGAEKVAHPFYSAMVKTVRTGDVGYVKEVIRNQFVLQGIDLKVANSLADAAATEVASQFAKHSRKLKVSDSVAYPLSALKRGASAIPIVGKGFGELSGSAVVGVFGEEAVKNNRRGSLEIEQWLDSIVSKEQALPSTVNNRTTELMTWMQRSEYAVLSLKERLTHFSNFIKADVSTAKLRKLTNNDTFIPVKVISKDAAETMKRNVADNIELIKSEITEAGADVGNVVDRRWMAIKEILEQTSGRDFLNNRHTLRNAFGKTGDLDTLYEAVNSLTKKRSSVDFSEWSKEAQKIAAELEGTGYRIGVAPLGKPISLVSEVIGEGGSRLTESVLDSKRTFVGTVVDDWGFSTKGVAQGSNSFFFNQNFHQLVLKDLSKKFGSILRLEDVLGTGRNIRLSTSELHDFLQKNIGKVNEFRMEEAGGRLLGLKGVLAEAFERNKVFDLTAKDLRLLGFSDEVAKAIDQINRKSLRDIPLSVAGMGDKLVNVMRGASRNLGIFGRHFDKYIKLASYARYRSAAAFMFQMQQGLETTVQGAMLVGGKYIPGAGTLLKMTSVLPDAAIGGIVERSQSVLRKIAFVPDARDVALTERYIVPNLQRGFDDVSGSLELSAIQQQLSQSKGAINGNKVNKLYKKHIQMWAIDKATKINMALAEKFGMTLKEVYALTDDGRFVNPRLVREMQETSQSILSYKTGFLTSPLAKTLNLVFFPFRFQAKTLNITAQWVSNLSPVSRIVLIDNLIHFSNWAGTEEGIEWRRAHQNLLYSVMAYATAYEQIGDSINAVARKQFFGGNTGLIGGIPFAWMVEFARDLALISEDPETYHPKTGQPFEFRETPRTVSATGIKLLEEYLFTLMPGMPFYTITGGIISQASFRHLLQNLIEGAYGFVLVKYYDFPKQAKDALIREQFMKIPMEETVFNR